MDKGTSQSRRIIFHQTLSEHGSSTKDSHKGAVDVSETWQDKELIPFQRLIADSLVDMVMTSHIFNRHFDADYPATLSYNFITKILRQRLGYMGVVVSDDLAMGAIATKTSN